MTHSDQKRIDAVTAYLVLGSSHLAEAATKVPAGTIRRWKMEPWWDDLVAQIQSDEDVQIDARLAKLRAKALDVLDDRLERGDFMYDPRSGNFKRRPVGLRDTWRVTRELMDIREILRNRPVRNKPAEAADGILRDLAKEFADMARRRLNEKDIKGEVVDAEFTELRPRLQTGSENGVQTTEDAPQAPETGPVPHGETGVGSQA